MLKSSCTKTRNGEGDELVPVMERGKVLDGGKLSCPIEKHIVQ